MMRRHVFHTDGTQEYTERTKANSFENSSRAKIHGSKLFGGHAFLRSKSSSRPSVSLLVAILGVSALCLCRGLVQYMQHHAQGSASSSLRTSSSHQLDTAAAKRMTSPEKTSPSMIQLGDDINSVSHATPRKDRTVAWLGEEFDDENCIPKYKWQLPSNGPSSCNILHELDMENAQNDLKFINCGGSRCAFETRDIHGPLVLKTEKYHSDYDEDDYQGGWKDTIAMERLTKSPFILNQYANCGVSQLVEMGTGGSLHDQIKIARLNGKDHMSPETRLRIGYHLAQAVADVHSIDSVNETSLVHNDLCCHQIILVDGVYKLNDFHLSSTPKVERDGNICVDRAKNLAGFMEKLRAPEELRFIYSGVQKYINRDKTDVWGMGDILYYILTKKWLFEGIGRGKAVQLIMAGNQSDIPTKFLKSTNIADQAMLRAIRMCWTFDPKQRPPAREVASFLKGELEKLSTSGRDGLYRVSIPPLPANHRFTETDFSRNLELI